MARYKIIYLLLLTYIVYVSAKEAEDRTLSQKPPDKLILQKSTPYSQEAPSFMTRLKNWFFPSSEPITAEGHHGGLQYLPPPQQYQSQPGCNPCNQSPWIPVASNVGHNTLINFVPPSSHVQEFRPPLTYGTPLPLPGNQYGPPSAVPHLPTTQFGQPPTNQYGPLQPPAQYGAPPSNQYAPPPSVLHGPPPSNHYGAPPGTKYGPPSSIPHVPLPSNQYAVPPTNQHSPPQSVEHGPASTQYGPPPALGFKPPPPPPQQHLGPVFRPRPNKLFPIHNMRPPPITHLNPVSKDYAPIDMRPPPLTGSYQSLPTTASLGHFLPPPPPSDSYGAPIVGPNADYQIRPEFLPPLEQVPLASNIPIPLPNLSAKPVAPIYNSQEFHHSFDNIPQQGANYEIKANHNVQVLPSVQVADFLASVEHPINVIQSPLVEVSVNNGKDVAEDHSDVKPGGFYNKNPSKLSDNPIVVEDTHTAASAVNVTIQESESNLLKDNSFRSDGSDILNSNLIKELLLHQENHQNKTFTPPPIDYSQWVPRWHASVASSMMPPPIGPTTWLQPVTSTTKKPKQIQIIVPYISSKQPSPFNKQVGRMVPSEPYSTLLPVYSPPSTTEEVWSQFIEDFNSAESKKITATAFTSSTTQVYNIRDLLKDTKTKEYYVSDKLPFDVISLQNNIDDWTQQSYSKNLREEKSSTSAKFVPSKQIPDDFFTTESYTESSTASYDHEQAGSNKKETKAGEDIESNLILNESTTEATTTTTQKPWDTAKVTMSPLTMEKLYIVTPQAYDHRTSTPTSAWSHPPRINLNQTVYPTPKFLVRVDPEHQTKRDSLKENVGPLTVVFSEWPHLINNLQTTTPKTPTSQHPLVGLMDLSKYTPPPNSTVETISGHSRVVTVVTPSAVTEKTRNAK